ncbi:MAG TPA: GntR family transcriptional regulator [Anaerolineae bacterium]|nr:GntR family transcriptional regulator [Anaerolineae bacterium]
MAEQSHPTPLYTPIKRDIDAPLYVQIERDFEISIATNRLKPGDLIPGEVELSNKYGVSRVTVRQAIKELVAAGLLYRIQGKGTFVLQPTIERIEPNITSFFYEMIESGRKPRADVSIEVRQADPEISRLLQLKPGETVIVIKRLRYVDDEPIIYQVNTIRESLCPDLVSEDLSAQSFQYTLEIKYNLRLVELEESLTCIKPTKELAQILGVPMSVPLLVATRMLYGVGGEIIGMAESHFRGDRYIYKVVRNMSLLKQ